MRLNSDFSERRSDQAPVPETHASTAARSSGESIPPVLAVGFKILPRRWVVERTFAWLGRYRRHLKDYDATPESSLAWVYIAFVRLLVQRMAILMEVA